MIVRILCFLFCISSYAQNLKYENFSAETKIDLGVSEKRVLLANNLILFKQSSIEKDLSSNKLNEQAIRKYKELSYLVKQKLFYVLEKGLMEDMNSIPERDSMVEDYLKNDARYFYLGSSQITDGIKAEFILIEDGSSSSGYVLVKKKGFVTSYIRIFHHDIGPHNHVLKERTSWLNDVFTLNTEEHNVSCIHPSPPSTINAFKKSFWINSEDGFIVFENEK